MNQKPRTWISTDLGSDPDDDQSLVHVFHYLSEIELEGISLCYPNGKMQNVLNALAAYRKDFKQLRAFCPDYPTANAIKNITYQGAKNKGLSTLNKQSLGVKNLIKAAMRKDDRPLLVQIWGSATDLANAIHKRPAIKKRIRVFAIGGWNREQDPESYRFLEAQRDLKWISSQSSGRGIYTGWPLATNRKYVEMVRKNGGALGKHFHHVSARINTGSYSIKMGDSPCMFWVLWSQNHDKLGIHTPGGKYRKTKGTNRYEDILSKKQYIGNYPGAKTVASKRSIWLKDWRQRLKAIYK